MELRAYWQIFWRRWWIAAALTLAVAAISLAASPLTQGGYTATMRLLVGVPSPKPSGDYFTYDKYYSFLSTEYVTDDFIEVVRSKAFLQDVQKEMGVAPATPLSVVSLPRTERAPRIITVVITSGNAAETQRAAEATVAILTTRAGQYFPQLGPSELSLKVIDPPVVTSPAAGGRNYLNVGLRTLLGLLAGVGLVFLFHYLDTAIYEPEEVDRYLQLPVLAQVPSYHDASNAQQASRPRSGLRL